VILALLFLRLAIAKCPQLELQLPAGFQPVSEQPAVALVGSLGGKKNKAEG
jgi:hypothetical protein